MEMEYQFFNKPLAESLYDAFQEEPFYLAIAKARNNQSESIKSALLKYFDFSIQEADEYGICYSLENQPFGASLWHKIISKELSQQKAEEKKVFLKNHLGQASMEVYQQIINFMEEKEKGIIENNYWHLSILAIAKQFQRKGYSKLLLLPVLTYIDKLGVPTFLETFTEGNLVLYRKNGYKIVKEFVEPTLNKTCWILVRQPA